VNLQSYCRDIEAYLCRKNDGHLIRITGPAFERVSQWAEQGIPLNVACAGIDRYFERYYRKGPRRRPVRVEFCEADVLDAFDAWRRAVGVASPSAEEVESPRPRASLAAHLERVMARLTSLRASAQLTRPLDHELERIVRELDTVLPQARTARGAARDALLTVLARLDEEMLRAALGVADEHLQQRAADEARSELSPFRARMTPEAHQRALAAAIARHVREHFGLPTLTFS
jgi:hypothetical protein